MAALAAGGLVPGACVKGLDALGARRRSAFRLRAMLSMNSCLRKMLGSSLSRGLDMASTSSIL